MKALIVYAHPEQASFNAALKNTAVETLTGLGHDVVVSDLYAMGWSPVLSAADFADRGRRAFYEHHVQLEALTYLECFTAKLLFGPGGRLCPHEYHYVASDESLLRANN